MCTHVQDSYLLKKKIFYLLKNIYHTNIFLGTCFLPWPICRRSPSHLSSSEFSCCNSYLMFHDTGTHSSFCSPLWIYFTGLFQWFYLFIHLRARACMSGRGGGRGAEGEGQTDSMFLWGTQSPVQGSVPWPHSGNLSWNRELDAQPTEPPTCTNFTIFKNHCK